MNVGAITRDDGTPGCSAAAKLYLWFREHSGLEVTTKDLERAISDELGICSAIQRVQEIKAQMDPRVEWIVKRVERVAGKNRHHYRHVFTLGQVPQCAHERHCQILRGLEGPHDQPVRTLERPTWFGSRAQRAASSTDSSFVPSRATADVSVSDKLFDDRPFKLS